MKSRSETKLEAVRTKVETLLAKRMRDLSYAEMLNAQDAIYQAAGFDTVPAEVADQSISGLAEAIGAQDRIIADGAVLQGLYGTQALKDGVGDYKEASASYRTTRKLLRPLRRADRPSVSFPVCPGKVSVL